jgi:hypothetical protein
MAHGRRLGSTGESSISPSPTTVPSTPSRSVAHACSITGSPATNVSTVTRSLGAATMASSRAG